MSISSGSSDPSVRRSSTAVEGFRVFAASSVSPSGSRLQRPGQLFTKAHDVATSVSPSGWVAACSSKDVRLYNVREANRSRDIPPEHTLTIPLLFKHEEIRAVALSEDILAVITYNRLLVYDDYHTSNDLSRHKIEELPIDQNQSWTARSVAISQNGRGNGAIASIAVGGEGESGVKVFRYVYATGWNPQSDRSVLKCRQNNGAVKVVGFSPCRNDAVHGSMVFALTTGNRLYCWAVGRIWKSGLNSVDHSWHFDCNAGNNERAFRDEISSAAFIVSPTGRPYILCTVNNRPGSHLPSTFIVPVNIFENNPQILRQQLKPLSEDVVGPNIIAGLASFNGRFLVVVESGKKKETIKLLTMQGAPGGGLTGAAARMLVWDAKVRANGTGASTISIHIEEQNGALEIIVVDGRGHVANARVSVPEMTIRDTLPPMSPRSPTFLELPYRETRRELSSEGSSRRSVTTSDQATERRVIIPG